MSSASVPMPDPVDPAAPTSRASVSWILIAVAAVSAVVIGGGAFAVMAVVGGGGDRPDSAMPGNAAFYAEIDIDPSVGQKVAALQFFDGMDTTELEEMRDGRGREALFDLIADEPDSPLSEMDYEADVEPWLGDRVGVGAIAGATEDEWVPVFAVQVKDEAAAEAFVDDVMAQEEASDEADFFFRGDYMVFTEVEDAESVKMAMDAGTLADNETYTSDMDSLGPQGIMSVWANLPAFQELSDTYSADVEQSLSDVGASQLLDSQAELQGRMAGTLRFDEDAIEFHGVAIDTGADTIEGGDSAQLISSLPDDTVAAFGLENGDQYVDQVWTVLEEAFPEDVAQAQEEAAAEGFELPGDIKTMVGDSLVVAAGPGIVDLDGNNADDVPVGYQASTDGEAAVALLEKVMEASGEDLGVPYGGKDGVFTVAGSEAYFDSLVAGGDLGSTRDFEVAVPDADEADMAAYVSLNQLESLYLPEFEQGQERDMAETMAAVGMRASSDGEGSGSFTLRLVFDE
ncbi:MAG: DUF3352 domain-containing protein [Ornithinimicrobium sp.]